MRDLTTALSVLALSFLSVIAQGETNSFPESHIADLSSIQKPDTAAGFPIKVDVPLSKAKIIWKSAIPMNAAAVKKIYIPPIKVTSLTDVPDNAIVDTAPDNVAPASPNDVPAAVGIDKAAPADVNNVTDVKIKNTVKTNPTDTTGHN